MRGLVANSRRLFEPEDTSTIFLRNVGKYLPVDTTNHSRLECSAAALLKIQISQIWNGCFTNTNQNASKSKLGLRF